MGPRLRAGMPSKRTRKAGRSEDIRARAGGTRVVVLPDKMVPTMKGCMMAEGAAVAVFMLAQEGRVRVRLAELHA